MKRTPAVSAVLAAIAVACAMPRAALPCWMFTCSPRPELTLGAIALIACVIATGVFVHATHITGQAHRRLMRLSGLKQSSLEELTSELSLIWPVVCVDSDERFALCAGAIKPRIYISRGFVAASGQAELRAVLLHEAHHARRRDPFRRAIRQGIAGTLFFVPLIRWWADRASVADELVADQAAIARCGVQPLARALLVAGGEWPEAHAAFRGAAAIRVRKLNGEPVTMGRPPARICVISVGGAVAITLTLTCVLAAPFLGL